MAVGGEYAVLRRFNGHQLSAVSGSLRRRTGNSGTRATIHTVLATLAEGMSTDAIIADFPSLSREAVQAVIVFAIVSTEEGPHLP